MINTFLYNQRCIAWSTLRDMTDAALCNKRYLISLTMHRTANADFHHAMQSCIRKFCPNTNSIIPFYSMSSKTSDISLLDNVYNTSQVFKDILNPFVPNCRGESNQNFWEKSLKLI